MNRFLHNIFILFVSVLACNAFVVRKAVNTRTQPKVKKLDASASTDLATLNEDTTWQLRLKLDSLPSLSGKMFNLRAKFMEEEGYEPPQGTIEQVFPKDSEDSSRSDLNQLKIKGGRWTLSEDPDDRKDGLWVWGLFQEPLYPFLLLTIQTEECVLDDGDEKSIEIPAMTFYAKMPHKRVDGAVILDTAELNLRNTQQLQLVGAVANYNEDTSIGQINALAL